MSVQTTRPAPGAAALSFPMLMAVLIGAEFTSALATGMVYTALAKLYAIYGDPAHVTWLVTAFGVTSAGSAVLFSRLGDIYGRGLMLKWMLAAVVVGAAISAVATDLDVIILGRAIQGLSAAILPLGFGILRENARDTGQLNFGVGLLGGTYALSVGVGFVLSGVIVDHWQWQHVFTVTGLASAVLLAWNVIVLPNGATRPTGQPLDMVGALVIVPLTALLLALSLGRSHGWTSPEVLGLAALGVASLAWWVWHELRHPDPMVQLRYLRHPVIFKANAILFLTSLAPITYPQVVLPMLQQPVWTGVGFGLTATAAGLLKLPTNLTSGLAGIGAGLFARTRSLRSPVALAALGQLAGFVVLLGWHDSVWTVVGACILLIAPCGTVIFGCAPGLIIEVTPPERTSEATGLASVVRAIGSAIGTQMVALTLGSSLIANDRGVKFPDEQAYVLTFALIAAVCVVCVVLAVMVAARRDAPEARAA